MAEHEFTADQIEEGIAQAIAERKFDLVEPLLLALVSVDPRRATQVWDQIQLGLALAKSPP